MKTITICNQKGGCGKTTTALTLAAGLSLRGFRVLAVDTDGQHSLTKICGVQNPARTLSDVIAGRATAAAAILRATRGGFDLLPGDLALSELPDNYRLDTLRGKLSKVAANYDYCIIDTPPALSVITMSALVAASDAILTALPDVLSLYGIDQAAETIDAIRPFNGALSVGILLTMYDGRKNLARTMREAIETRAQAMGAKVYRQTIRAGVAVQESQLLQTDLFTSAPRAGVTADYNAFIDEFLEGA